MTVPMTRTQVCATPQIDTRIMRTFIQIHYPCGIRVPECTYHTYITSTYINCMIYFTHYPKIECHKCRIIPWANMSISRNFACDPCMFIYISIFPSRMWRHGHRCNTRDSNSHCSSMKWQWINTFMKFFVQHIKQNSSYGRRTPSIELAILINLKTSMLPLTVMKAWWYCSQDIPITWTLPGIVLAKLWMCRHI